MRRLLLTLATIAALTTAAAAQQPVGLSLIRPIPIHPVPLPPGAYVALTQQTQTLQRPYTGVGVNGGYGYGYGGGYTYYAPVVWNYFDDYSLVPVPPSQRLPEPLVIQTVTYTAPATPTRSGPSELVLRAPTADAAAPVVTVRLPASAELVVNGTRYAGGAERTVVLPARAAGQTTAIELRASWQVEGRVVERRDSVSVKPGDRQTVLFLR